MFGMFKNLFGKAKDMSGFQVLIGSLCYRNHVECGLPPKVLLGFGMITALEEGLRGETDNYTFEDVLESSLAFKNPFFICPAKMFGLTSGLGGALSEITPVIMALEMKKRSLNQSGPFKMFIVDRIISNLHDLLGQRGQKIPVNQESYEGLLAIALRMGLLYFHENQAEALKLAKEPRPPNPYPTRN